MIIGIHHEAFYCLHEIMERYGYEHEDCCMVRYSYVAFYNTPIRGLSTIFKKSTWDLVYPADFWDTREIREI